MTVFNADTTPILYQIARNEILLDKCAKLSRLLIGRLSRMEKRPPGTPEDVFDCFVHYSMHSMVQACSRVAVP